MSGDLPTARVESHILVMSYADLRRHSTWLLAHAKGLREEAKAARLRSMRCREQSQEAIEPLREKKRLCEGALSRHSSRLPSP